MDDLNELKRRKEQLELERDIARLEREARIGQAVTERVDGIGAKADRITKWSWAWVGPLTAVGLWCMAMGTLDKNIYPAFIFLVSYF